MQSRSLAPRVAAERYVIPLSYTKRKQKVEKRQKTNILTLKQPFVNKKID